MSDEIVARLRAVPKKGNGMCCGSNSTIPNPYYSRCQDAADEIERWRKLAIHAWCHMGVDATCSSDDCEECQAIEGSLEN